MIKNKKNIIKKSIIGVLAISVVATSAFCFSSAFLSDKETVTNTFITTGDVDLDFSEPSWKVEYGELFKPGDNNPKDPTIVEKKGDAYLRVKMEITDAKGDTLTGTDDVSVAEQVAKIKQTLYYDSEYTYNATTGAVTPNIDLSSQYSSSDLASLIQSGKISALHNSDFAEEKVSDTVSYFNYTANESLVPEGSTVVMFSNVTIPVDWTSDDMSILDPTGKGYIIKLTAEAVQHDNVSSFKEAFANFED